MNVLSVIKTYIGNSQKNIEKCFIIAIIVKYGLRIMKLKNKKGEKNGENRN
jgi:hypothetical protein